MKQKILLPVQPDTPGALAWRQGLLYPRAQIDLSRYFIPHIDPEEPPIPMFKSVTSKTGEKYVWLPWNCGRLDSQGLDYRHEKTVAFPASSFKPRHDDQAVVLGKCVKLLTAGHSFIAKAATGWGKTVVGTQVAIQFGQRTLITVTKDDIKAQWLDSIHMLLGKNYPVGIIQGDQVNTNSDLVISMVHSLCKQDRYPKEALENYGLHVVDEVHRMGAESFSQAAWNMWGRQRIGWTATDWRSDGRDCVFQGHIGKVEVIAKQKAMGFQVFVVRTDFKLPRAKGTDDPMAHKPGKTGHISKMLAGNVRRNKAIVNCIMMAHEKERQTIVFSDRLDHLKTIRWMLEAKGVLAKEIGMYVGGCKPDEIKHRPILLATYSYCSEGTDIPTADTLVMSIPRSNVVQIIGRILREHEGKRLPTVFDFLDEDSWVFCKYYEKRVTFYGEAQAPVKIVPMSDLV